MKDKSVLRFLALMLTAFSFAEAETCRKSRAGGVDAQAIDAHDHAYSMREVENMLAQLRGLPPVLGQHRLHAVHPRKGQGEPIP